MGRLGTGGRTHTEDVRRGSVQVVEILDGRLNGTRITMLWTTLPSGSTLRVTSRLGSISTPGHLGLPAVLMIDIWTDRG